MPIISTPCPVLQAQVTRLMDLEGTVTRVFCPEYDAATGACRLKTVTTASGGPLSRLLARVERGTLDRGGSICDLM